MILDEVVESVTSTGSHFDSRPASFSHTATLASESSLVSVGECGMLVWSVV